ncbi:MAG: ChbG/HpnK family deacetylase [Candidatus Omnitrophota bacterium]
MVKKRLIINADEFGMARCTTDAIWECLNKGALTSTTIVANGADFARAAGFARGKDFCGLHLSLADIIPVSRDDRIPSLMRPDGKRLMEPNEFLKRYFTKKINLDEVKVELEGQMIKCIDHGIDLTHVDGHCNLHVLPGIFKIVIGLMKKYGIRKFRYPRDPLLNIDWGQPSQYIVKTGIAFFSMLGRGSIPEDAVFTDRVLGVAQSTRITEDVMLRLLSMLKNGSTEIPIHPGNYDAEDINSAYGNDTYASTYFRHTEKEKAALLSVKVKKFIADHGIELISYRGL